MEKFKKSRNLFIWWGEKRFHELQNILIQMIVQEESDHVHSMIKLTHYKSFIEDMKYQYSTVINLLIGNIQLKFSNFPQCCSFWK